MWALANAELTQDKELWSTLKNLVLTKDFASTVVSNVRWSASNFQLQSGCEHFFQSELSEFAESLFFKDHINIYELYNGLVSAQSQNKALGLEAAIASVESRYGDQIRRNDQFKGIESEHTEPQPYHV